MTYRGCGVSLLEERMARRYNELQVYQVKRTTIMKKNIGLWIDRRKAVIVSIAGDKEKIEHIESQIEKRPHSSGGAGSKLPYLAQDAVAEDRLQKNYQLDLNRYYDRVIVAIRDAESIYIFGPSLAPVELKKRIALKAPRLNVVDVEAADKMTENQIRSKVRELYQSAA